MFTRLKTASAQTDAFHADLRKALGQDGFDEAVNGDPGQPDADAHDYYVNKMHVTPPFQV